VTLPAAVAMSWTLDQIRLAGIFDAGSPAVLCVAAGLGFGVGGVIWWWTHPGEIAALLAIGAGVVLQLGLLRAVFETSGASTVGWIAYAASPWFLVHLLTLRSELERPHRVPRPAVWATYWVPLLLGTLWILTWDPGISSWRGARGVPLGWDNPALVAAAPPFSAVVDLARSVALVAVLVWLVHSVYQRTRALSVHHRRSWGLVLWAGIFWASARIVAEVSSYLPFTIPDEFVRGTTFIPVLLTEFGLPYFAMLVLGGAMAGYLWAKELTAGASARVVVGLADGGVASGTLSGLSDSPSMQVVYPDRTEGWIDTAGSIVQVPTGEDVDRAMLLIERHGQPLAALIHDRWLPPSALTALAKAIGLGIENQRLAEEATDQLDELRASRERLVAAEEETRRVIERDLHDGPQQRLVALGARLGLLRATPGATDVVGVDLAVEAVDDVIEQVQRAAAGAYPPDLASGGLEHALVRLAATSPIPVTLRVQPVEVEPVAVAIYFITSEGITNSLKHSSASRIEVTVERQDNQIVARVVDDGKGGADRTGSGLTGLTDRIAALGGAITVTSPPGQGTQLEVLIPLPAL
jgi:signal transduction histidine kinase